jgi:hypothetical protein
VPDYTPPYPVGRALTLTTSGAVIGGDILVVTGSGTVAALTPNATPSTKVVGVAANDTPSGGRVTVWGFGPVHESIAVGTVTAGDQVVAAATAGRQIKTAPAVTTPTAGDVTNTRSILGIALTTAADGIKARWMQALG